MKCRQCGDEMVLITTIQGSYNSCKACSNVDFAYHDDDEVDSVVIRGRD